MTDDRSNGTETTRTDYQPALVDVSHTHPDTDEAFGTAMAYKRGPVVAADGGQRDAVGENETDVTETEEDERDGNRTEGDADSERMRDVDHAPPNSDDVNRVHERGGEGRDVR